MVESLPIYKFNDKRLVEIGNLVNDKNRHLIICRQIEKHEPTLENPLYNSGDYEVVEYKLSISDEMDYHLVAFFFEYEDAELFSDVYAKKIKN